MTTSRDIDTRLSQLARDIKGPPDVVFGAIAETAAAIHHQIDRDITLQREILEANFTVAIENLRKTAMAAHDSVNMVKSNIDRELTLTLPK